MMAQVAFIVKAQGAFTVKEQESFILKESGSFYRGGSGELLLWRSREAFTVNEPVSLYCEGAGERWAKADMFLFACEVQNIFIKFVAHLISQLKLIVLMLTDKGFYSVRCQYVMVWQTQD